MSGMTDSRALTEQRAELLADAMRWQFMQREGFQSFRPNPQAPPPRGMRYKGWHVRTMENGRPVLHGYGYSLGAAIDEAIARESNPELPVTFYEPANATQQRKEPGA